MIGAALGALLVLLGHPISRAYYAPSLWGLFQSDPLRQTPYLPQNIDDPPPPDTLLDGAYWLMLGADVRQRQVELEPEDRQKLVAIAMAGAEQDDQNAFWLQMASCWVYEEGDEAMARELWHEAAKRPRWNDYQTDRLAKIVATEGAPGWTHAFAYNARSLATAKLVQRQAGRFFDRTGLVTREDLELRVDNLLNGALLRDEGRMIEASLIGTQIVATAPLSRRPGGLPEVREALQEREAFLQRLQNERMEIEAQQSARVFAENDAYSAMVDRQAAQRNFNRLAWMAWGASAIPGSLVALALAGALLGLVGLAFERSRFMNWVFAPPWCAVAGIALGISVYVAFRDITAAIWATLSLGFFAFVPGGKRSAEPGDLGPMYRYSLVLLGLLTGLSLLIGLSGLGIPSQRLLPLLEVPRELGPRSMALLLLPLVFLGVAVASAPAWALLHRFEARLLAGRILRQIGVGLCVASLALAVVAGPLAISADRYAGKRLERLAQNEPLVYFQR